MSSFFSIIIPLYNKEQHIKATLESVLNQSFEDFEVLVINDGSTDNSVIEVNTFVDERITLFDTENKGVSAARNYGIEQASSNFIAFLDADDLWYPYHLEDLKKLIEQHPNCGLYAKGYESVFYGDAIFKAEFLNLNANYKGIVEDYFHHSLINQIAWTSAVVIPKSILDTYGSFDTSMKTGEDTDLWTRVALKESVAFDSKVSAQKIMTATSNHLSKSSYSSDRLNLLNKFSEDEISNPSFKKYMDYIRFSIAIERKIEGDVTNFKKVKQDIHPNSLNNKQKFLLWLSGPILVFMKNLQSYLLKHKIYLSAFR